MEERASESNYQVLAGCHWATDSQSVVPGPVSSASPANLLERQVL